MFIPCQKGLKGVEIPSTSLLFLFSDGKTNGFCMIMFLQMPTKQWVLKVIFILCVSEWSMVRLVQHLILLSDMW